MKFMYKIVLLLIVILPFKLFAQELNATVKVNATQIQGVQPRLFESLEKSIYEFLNNRKWTNDAYDIEERIECSFFINIKSNSGTNAFSASILVQSRRPVYNSSYNSTILNYQDEEFSFEYQEFQPFDFAVNQYTNNLTSILGFYAYMIIAMDADTYELEGGTQHYNTALTIVNNAQTGQGSGAGWKPGESDRNRYWMVTNLLNKTYAPIRSLLYNYHRKGLDIMYKELAAGKAQITASLNGLLALHKVKPVAYNTQILFNGKSDEIVNIFSEGSTAEKQNIVDLASQLDPGNNRKYRKIIEQR